MLAAGTALVEFIPDPLAARRVADENGNRWIVRKASTDLAQNNGTKG